MRINYLLFFSLVSIVVAAQDGFRIEVDIQNFDQTELYLAYHLGENQYIQDTVQKNEDNHFVFEGEEPLVGGVYLVVMPPDNQYFQVLVDEKNQRFGIEVQAGDQMMQSTKFDDSADNTMFYEYLNHIASKRPEAEKLQAELQAADKDRDKERIQSKIDIVNTSVTDFQKRIVTEHPESITAAIINANIPLETPEFEGTDAEIQESRWRWTQQHYFDNIDLSDPRLLRTPFFFSRIDYFVQKLHVQHPDTIVLAIDYVLEKMEATEDNFKFYLIHFLNFYAASKYVGMDAVYVKLVEKYYATGRAPWTEEEQLTKIVDNAVRLKPLLIGKIAPNIEMQRRDDSKIALHDVDSDYTVLYFWRYDCGHCKTSLPDMKAFYENFHDKGVELFAVCTKNRDEVKGCWEYIDENEIGNWLHVVDPFMRSRYATIYDIKSTPQIYILNRDKEIISKRIGAEQLEDLMNQILERDAMEKQTEMLENK